jgi:hypothetical protein
LTQDLLQQAKERYSDAKEAMREQHARMREDMKFSNPADPQQWTDDDRKARKGRPSLTFDRTNQFIMQVVNDGRQNKPSIQCLPADSEGDPAVAEKLNGIIRHVEYQSRAGIAYDTALESAARCGLGWLRVIPQVMRPETNEQEVRILRVHDPLSILLDPGSTEPNGSDAMYGFAETTMTERAFKAAFPKAEVGAWESDGWFGDKNTRICEYFGVKETKTNNIVAMLEGQQQSMLEADYWEAHKEGRAIMLPDQDGAAQTFEAKERTVKWCKMSGLDILEETIFPSQFLPLIPVLGYELWIDGKRYLCGMTRRLMDGQRFHNYAASATAESIASQPKAPFIVPFEGIENFEPDWQKLNSGNPAYLPYNSVNENGDPIPAPSRLSPPVMSQGFAGLLEYSSASMESAVGMFKANLGQQDNASSGRAIRARQQEGDTANFHYLDNRDRGIEQLGRVVVDMVTGRKGVYDTQRQARILGDDGKQDFVQIDPNMPQAVRKDGKKVVAINLNVGAYDVRVKSGPSFANNRQEAAQQIVDLTQGNPQLAAAMAPLLMKLQDLPDSEKAYRVALAMLPPPVQEAYDDEEGEDIPPQAAAKMHAMQQQLQEMEQALNNAAEEADGKRAENELRSREIDVKQYEAETKQYEAETKREEIMLPAMDPEQIQALVLQTVADALTPDDEEPEMQEMPPEPPEQMPPPEMAMPQDEPPPEAVF